MNKELNNHSLNDIHVGDMVTIVTYGHLVMIPNDEGGLEPKDTMPNLVGKCGKVDMIKGKLFYIKGVGAKYGPYNKEQLQKQAK